MNYQVTFRHLLVLVLLLVFLWQIYVSLQKCVERRIITTTEEMFQDQFQFPSVSFCPLKKDDEGTTRKTTWSFEEEFSSTSRRGRIVRAFSHQEQKRLNMTDYDRGDLSDPRWNGSWTHNIGLVHESLNVTSCETYTPPPMITFQGGLASTASFYVDTRGTNNVLVYVHNHPRDLLTPSTVFGSSRLFLPRVAENYRGSSVKTFLFKLVQTDVRKLERSEYPCRRKENNNNDDDGILDCVQEYNQRVLNCTLPWRKETQYEICKSNAQLLHYKDLGGRLTNASPVSIYQQTGCYYGCNYFKYSQELMSQDVSEEEEEEDKDYSVRLDMYMVAAAVKVETERLLYDQDDFIANVGGFMGLLLGWSLLQIFDEVRMQMGVVGRRVCELARKKSNSVTPMTPEDFQDL